jgi:DHA1 family bicyclomycin/chloramphenicol resistance-like MFS transporter
VSQSNSPLKQYRYIFYAFAGLVAIAPLAMDTYLPAFPIIADYLQVDIATIQYTLVTFMLGSTFGQFFGGPLSDAIGRLRVGFIGCILFCLASLGIAATTDIGLLLVARAAQGFSAGAAGVVVSAIISEHYEGKDSARMMLSVTMVIMGVPLIAPLIGTALLKLANWRFIFYFLAFYSCAVAIIVHIYTPKKRLRPKDAERRKLWTGVVTMFRNYRNVMAQPLGRLYLMGMGLNVAVYMVFATSASFAYMEYLGASLELFPFLLGANTISLLIGNRMGIVLLRHYEPYHVCLIGGITLAASSLILLLVVVFSDPSLYTVVGLIILIAGSIPMSGPIASSIFMALYDKNAGTASASMGIGRVAFGMVGGFIVTLLHNGTLYPMAITMFVVAVGAMACFLIAGRRLAKSPRISPS